MSTPPKFNSSPLKNDAWKTILSFWDETHSQGLLLLNFQGPILWQSQFQANGQCDVLYRPITMAGGVPGNAGKCIYTVYTPYVKIVAVIYVIAYMNTQYIRIHTS